MSAGKKQQAAPLKPASVAPESVAFKAWTHYNEDKARDGRPLPYWAVVRFAGRVADIANGVAMVGKLVEWEALKEEERQGLFDPANPDEDDGPPRVLSPNDLAFLQRLAITSAEMLSDEASSMIKWAEEHHAQKDGSEGGRA
jgi:hypothetical protein